MPKKARPRPQQPTTDAPEVVDPLWILKALGLTFLVAIVCGYLTLWALFYQGQWQLVLHPSIAVPQTPATLGLQFEPIQFAVDETGKPQLTGWFIPAAIAGPTVLYLHDGDSTLTAALPHIQRLHALQYSVFAIDYRGYGASASIHPSQTRMNEDAEHALAWLTATRKLPASQIIPYGLGVGASIAATLAAAHPELPALILEDPKSDLYTEVSRDNRTHLLPLRLLFRNDFPLAPTLPTLHQPKLLLTTTAAPLPLYRTAAAPKRIAQLPAANQPAYDEAIRRFAEEYLTQPVPIPAPPTK